MDKVKIKRVKRNKRQVTTADKVLAGLGVASSLASTGGSFIKPNQTAIVSTNSNSASGEVKQTLQKIFGATLGVEQAKADDTLTAQNASTTPYDPSLDSQLAGIQPQLVSLILSGQVASINGNSVTAFMLGWGGDAAGTTQTILGQTYNFDGSVWQLESQTPAVVAPSISGIQGYDPTTNQYTNNTATAGQYLILYGSFSSNNDNQVQIDGQTANITGQTQNQINVLLSSSLAPGSHTVTVSNSGGTSSPGSFSVAAPVPDIQQITVTGYLANAIVGQSYNASLTASNGNGSYTWTAQGLPAGLTFNNGTITGTPSQSGNFTVTVTASDGVNTPGSQQFNLEVNPAPMAAPTIAGIQGYNVVTNLYTNTTAVPGNYLILYGNFSPNQDNVATIDGQQANITGQTQNQINILLNANLALGSHTVTVSNSGGTSSPGSFSVAAPQPAITQISISGTLATATVGQQYSAYLSAANGNGNYTWTAQGLPSGLAIDPSSGAITGTPSQSGTFTITVSASDGVNTSGTQNYTLQIAPAPVIAQAPSISGIQGYDPTTNQYTNNTATAGQYLILYGSFSAGQDNQVQIDGQQANITGQTQNQINVLLTSSLASGNHSVTVSDSGGISSQSSFAVASPAPVITQITVSGSLANATAGQQYSASLSALNGSGNYTWAAQGLPAGLTFNNGTITGTPSQSGNFTVTVTASDGVNTPGSQEFTLEVNPTAVSDARLQQIITQANTILYASLSGDEQTALTNYLTANPTALTDQNFSTFAPGSVFAWALGMGTSTSLNLTAQSLGFVLYDSTQGFFVKQQPQAQQPLAVTTQAAVTTANVGDSYSLALSATGGSGSYTWTAQGLPPGVSLNGNSISGTLTQPSDSLTHSYTFTVTANDGNQTASQSFSLQVVAQTPVVAGPVNPDPSPAVTPDPAPAPTPNPNSAPDPTTPAPVIAQAPSISGIQGYDPTTNQYTNNTATAGQYLILYGSFSANQDNQVQIDGQQANETAQTANQINILLPSTLAAGSHTVTVSNSGGSSGQSSFTVSAPAVATPPTAAPAPAAVAPALNGAQGYNSATNVYTNSVVGSNQSLILYGNFAASGNTVSINGQSLPASSITYQSLNQINVLMGDLTGQTSLSVAVSNSAGSSQTLSVNVALVAAQTPSNSATISGVQGYDPSKSASDPTAYTDNTALANTYLILYGNFDASGDTVTIDGQPATVTGQTANQINVSLAGVSAGSHSAVVTTSFGVTTAAAFTVTAPTTSSPTASAPVLNSTQGYNPITNSYETSANTIGADDTYLILYGNFAASGNTVSINGQALPASGVTYQSASQINISLTNVPITGYSFNVGVSNTNGASQSLTVAAPNQDANAQAKAVPLVADVAAAANVPAAFLQGLTPIGSPVLISEQVQSGKATYTDQFSVQYYQMADGETEAVFTYGGQGIVDYSGWTFVVRGNSAGHILGDGSVQASSQLEWESNGAAPLINLVQGVIGGMPQQKTLIPGITFFTPVNAATNTYYVSGLYPVTLTLDANGNIIALQPVNATGFGSDVFWFNLGNGNYIDTTANALTNQLIYYLHLDGTTVTLQNAQVIKDANGNPNQITAQINGANVTLNVASSTASGSVSVSSSSLQIVNINAGTSNAPQYLVICNGQMVGLVGVAEANAYQYVLNNNLSSATVNATPSGNYQVIIGSGSSQQTLTFNTNGELGDTAYQNEIDEQDGMVVLQEADGSISVAYGSSDPADAQTLNDVTLNKDSSGDITSAIGTDSNGVKVALVSVGSLWAAIPVNANETFPNASGMNTYPNITLYGEDSATGQMNAILTLSSVIFSGTTSNITDLSTITGLTPTGASLSLNASTTFSSNTQGTDLSSMTFTSMGADPNGGQDWAAMVNGQVFEIVNDQGKAVLEYAQQNNLQVIDFGDATSIPSATTSVSGSSTVSSSDLSQYYYLVTNQGVQIIDGNSGQAVTDPGILQQISQSLGVTAPNLGDLSWLANALINAGDMSIPAAYVSPSSSSTPFFVVNDATFNSLQDSFYATYGSDQVPSQGGFTMPYEGIVSWATTLNQAIVANNGQVPENMQAFLNFMTQPVPVYDQNGNQTGTTQLAYLNNNGGVQEVSLNTSMLQPDNSTGTQGGLIIFQIDQEDLNNPSTISNALQSQWLITGFAHELQHAEDSNDLTTNYGGNIDLWLDGGTGSDGTAVAPSATAQYVHGLPDVVQAFLDISLVINGAAGYNLGDPVSVVTESAAYMNNTNTIVATLQSNNSNFPNEAAALQWAVSQLSSGASVTANADGSLQVKYSNNNIINVYNIDNPSQMAIEEISPTGVITFTTDVGQAGSMSYLFSTGADGQSSLNDMTLDGQAVVSPGQTLILYSDPQDLITNGTLSYRVLNSDGSAAYDVSVINDQWNYSLPDGTPLMILPAIGGSGTSFYVGEDQPNGSVVYQELYVSGDATGGTITKNANGSVVISDGQGNTVTQNADGSYTAQITMQSEQAGLDGEQVTVNYDAQGNVTSWTDGTGTYTGDATALTSAMSAAGLVPASSTAPSFVSDPTSVSQFISNISQQVADSGNNDQQTNTDPATTDPGSQTDPGSSDPGSQGD